MSHSPQSAPAVPHSFNESQDSAPSEEWECSENANNSKYVQVSKNPKDSADPDDSEDPDDADDSEDADDTEDADDAEGSDDAEDADDSEDSATPKTPLKKLEALAEKACSLVTLPRDRMNAGLANWTRALAAACSPLPAATAGSLALGLPHAHPAHPPFVPLPPIGPAILGFSSDVLINGMPALVNGALGMSPTCCGLSPFYEVLTGSSKVLISGERAVRLLDLTFHCQSAPRSSSQPQVARLRRTLEVAERALEVKHQAEDTAEYAEQSAEVAGSVRSAKKTHNPALREAVAHSATMATTSRLADKAQEQLRQALTKLMGRDPATPTGTPGAIVHGAANVLIGGFPLPDGSTVVRGLLRLLPGKLPPRRASAGKAPGPHQREPAPSPSSPSSPPSPSVPVAPGAINPLPSRDRLSARRLDEETFPDRSGG